MPRRPVNQPYTITTEFGVQDTNAFFGYHSGVDYAVGLNTPICAPINSTIIYRAFNSTGGNMLILFDGKYYHRLMHNNSFAAGQSVNSQVSEGQVVAYAGTTGLSTGVHCHWDISDEIISSATPRPSSFAHFIDPAKWLAGQYVTNQGEVMNQEAGAEMYRTALHREAESVAGASQWNGQTPASALRAVRGTEWQIQDAKLKAYDTLQAQVAELSARPTKDELQTVVQTLNTERDKVSSLESQLAEEKAKPPIQIPVEVIKEVEPSWLTKVREFINNFLGRK